MAKDKKKNKKKKSKDLDVYQFFGVLDHTSYLLDYGLEPIRDHHKIDIGDKVGIEIFQRVEDALSELYQHFESLMTKADDYN